jgi:CheY-like chemotaxis protein
LVRLSGHETRIAHAGPAALRIAREFHPEVVLLDIGLPRMDGFAVAAELRKLPEAAPAKIAAISGYGQEDDRRRSREAGFDAHFLKPVDFDALRDFIETAKSVWSPAAASRSS